MEEMITSFIVPLVIVACYAFGAALKATQKFPDKYIPLTLFVVGAIINPLISGFSSEAIIVGAVSGWAAVGLNQTVKQISKEE